MKKMRGQYGEILVIVIGCIISIVASINSNILAVENERISDSTTRANTALQQEILMLQKSGDSIQRIINNTNDTIKNLQRVIIELQGDMNSNLKGVGYPIIIPKITKIGLSEFLEVQVKNIHPHPVSEVKIDFIDIYNQTKDRIIEEHVKYTGKETPQEIQASIERKARGYNRNYTFISLSSGETREIYFEKIVGYFTYVEFSINVVSKFGKNYECRFMLSSNTPEKNITHIKNIYYKVDNINYTEKEFVNKYCNPTSIANSR